MEHKFHKRRFLNLYLNLKLQKLKSCKIIFFLDVIQSRSNSAGSFYDTPKPL